MEWLCTTLAGDDVLDENKSSIASLNDITTPIPLNAINNLSYAASNNATYYSNDTAQLEITLLSTETWGFLEWTKKVAVPCLCIFGIVGNLLNIAIFSKKIREGVDTMEKGALVGMMALAGSDLLFCLVTISGTYLPGARMLYYEQDFVFYYTLYGNCIQNILIKNSTWLTVILAASRYFVVSNPIKARQYMRCGHTVVAIVICTIIWILLHIPLTWMWKVITVHCRKTNIYLLHPGEFDKNIKLHNTWTNIWAILGFILPIIILLFCNLKLIYSLNLSRRLRKRTQEGQNCLRRQGTESSHGNPRLITVTLIAIVTAFFTLVLPSEVLHFYGDLAKPAYLGPYRILLLSSNLLQALNFSMNFALYCLVNQYFRKTIKHWLMWLPFIAICMSRRSEHHRMTSMSRGSSRIHSVSVKQTAISRQSSRSSIGTAQYGQA